MLTAERYALIQQIVKEQSSVSVTELAKRCYTSEVTIRRDLTNLERDGIITRVRGGAILADLAPDYLATRFEEHRSAHLMEKQIIGLTAASLIGPGETVILDSGSTVFELVHCLAGKHKITAIVTSIRIAEELEQYTGINTILTGGTLRARTTSLVNPMLDNSLQSVMASKVFLGASGISLKHGFTTGDFAEADVKKTLIAHAQEVIVLADSSKLNQVRPAFIGNLDCAHTLITDYKADPEIIKELQKTNLKVIIAEPSQETLRDITANA